MSGFRFTTAGESHGPGLVAIVEGMPAGLELDREALDGDMARRQLGHGRGGRMKIETDTVEIRSGLRHGRTLGSPIAILVANRDYSNWEERMNPWPVDAEVDQVHLPRPGHADLVGAQKYGHEDIRNVLERASARETAARVAAGSIARGFLTALGVSVHSHVTQIASVKAPEREDLGPEDFATVDDDPVRCLDSEASAAMVEEINRLRKANESLGGTFEVRAFGLEPLDRPGVHPLLPVGVVAVRDQHGHGTAERSPVADTGADLDRVALDLHPPAAAVPELAPRHVGIDPPAIELEPRGQPLDDRDQPGAVRLAGGGETKRCH